jgi:alpha-mannosidase
MVQSYYSEMRCGSMEVTSAGPTLGEIVTKGQIIDQKDDFPLADYTQTTRVWRHRPVVEVELELDLHKSPEADPWTNYYALRFAWNDSTAVLTRSVQDFAFGFRGERFDSPDYLEIAEGDQRTTLLFHGLPFHRKTGMRMLDTLLVTSGETKRHFRFGIAIDQSYPLVAAREAMTPVIAVPTETGPPRSGPTGWFFHQSAKNVQILSVRGTPPPAEPDGEQPFGFVVRLAETEGRPRDVKLQCFRAPASARTQDFQGNAFHTLAIAGDAVSIPMHGYEIIDVELRF